MIVCLTWGYIASCAQTDTINVSGQVRCGTEPAKEVIVTMLQPSDSSIVAYSVTDEQGRYSLNATVASDEMLIKVTGFNIRSKVVRIKSCSQTCAIAVEEENMKLREVVVKAQKLWGSRDTLNYLVSAYTREHDRTIADVLRQLPGITITDDGTINYQGTPINRFYIENLDMLQGRYNLATEGIKAEDVATVQVMENHEHVKALQDQVPPENAAINLKLKNKAKGVWTTNMELGAGGYADGPLWDATLQTMYFGSGEQHQLRYSGDNMGRSNDAAMAHYGMDTEDVPNMVGIVSHGSSPVGNSLFGYRHGVNLNNLRKLSEDVTLNYNLNYSHNLSRGSSYARTTYILPDGTDILLTEDISDRIHTNAADLKLIYEKNTSQQFLNNTFSLSGKWNKGQGNVSAITQTLHCKSLALNNRTRWVHRTARGGGFEWTSNNSVASSPQSLVIDGDMTARQDIGITTISTINDFETLRDLRAHSWTLSLSAQANASYTSLATELSQPNMLADGRLSYLNGCFGVGPLLRYVKGSFRTTLRFPLTLTYTHLDNTDIPGETTDAKRTHLRFQPSFLLLWKASDNFTFNGNVDYSSSETPWSQLYTTHLMQNYRSLSRYRALLSDSYSASARLKISFKDIFNGLFAYAEGGWHRSWSDITYGTTLDEQAHTILESISVPNHDTGYRFTLYGRKDIDWHTMQLELTASATTDRSQILRQSVLMDYKRQGYMLSGTLAFDIVTGYRIDYSARWQRSHSASTGYATTFSDFSQSGRLTMRLVPSRLFFNVNASHSYNSSLLSSRKNFIFLGTGLQWKASKKLELNLDGDNLTNIRTFIIRNIGDLEEHYEEYHLRPLSVTLKINIYI